MKRTVLKALLIIFLLLSFKAYPQKKYLMHPVFKPLGNDGKPITGQGKKISGEKTCGQCHDSNFINAHSSHYNKASKVDCIECHFEGKKLSMDKVRLDMSGNLIKEDIKIQIPRVENCMPCHGLAMSTKAPIHFPDDYFDSGKYDLTKATGAVFSPGFLKDSDLNLVNKDGLAYPWDVHANRDVSCINCHYTKNNPRRDNLKKKDLPHLLQDPRIPTLSEYLYRPDHSLGEEKCVACHDPYKVHGQLPYKKRHFEVLACESCHMPGMLGSSFMAVDETVMTKGGYPRIEYRSLEKNADQSLDVAYTGSYSPYLFKETKSGKITPFNFITTWRWRSGKDKENIDPKILQKVFLDGKSYRKDILRAFDADKNGDITESELIINSEEKLSLISSKLQSTGINEPNIVGEITLHRISHGTVRGKWVRFGCDNCHGPSSRFSEDVLLSVNAPFNAKPIIKKKARALINGEITKESDGRFILKRADESGAYLLGLSRVKWLDRAGFLAMLATFFVVLIHMGRRIYLRNKMKHLTGGLEKVYMYSLYERIWHWTMSIAIILLILTGLELHFYGRFSIFGLEASVNIHNILAAVLIINAFLSLFYHLASSQISQFIPPIKSFEAQAVAQLRYYLFGIFKGEPHPLEKRPEKKLNPLQQVTYLLLLNVLLPLQVITGVLMWGLERWPSLSEAIGGLKYLAPIHSLGSWLFISFIIMHVYLTTTGQRPLSYIKAMLNGYEEIEINRKK